VAFTGAAGTAGAGVGVLGVIAIEGVFV